VNAEDTDWLVYHRLPENGTVAEIDLASGLGLDTATIAASLGRLERSCLIERLNGKVRMLTFGEALLKNQCKYEEDLPYVIENGVIKSRKPSS
jgi:Mn-dependent DtxR family transcriptional regulator